MALDFNAYYCVLNVNILLFENLAWFWMLLFFIGLIWNVNSYGVIFN